MFNAQPPPDEALWFLEYVLFGWWWHPVLWFGWIVVASIVICFMSTWRGALATIIVLLLFVLCVPANAESQCLGSCWSCMHGCTEQERVEKCCPAGTQPTHHSKRIERRMNDVEKKNCQTQTGETRDNCFFWQGVSKGRNGR